MTSMLRDIIDSVLNPTTKPQAGVVRLMNFAFYGLFLTLLTLAWATSWNIHVLALTGVAIALFASISWFIAELGKIEEEKQLATPGEITASEDVDLAASSKSTAMANVQHSIRQRPT